MATKKSASKKSATKVSAKKAGKKVVLPPPPPPPPGNCIRSCYLAYRHCLLVNPNKIVCQVRYVRCIVRCTGLSRAVIKKALK